MHKIGHFSQMNSTVKGTLFGILAAVCYGTNPLGALFLYRDHVNTHTVLSHRFGLAVIILFCIMLFRRESFRITKQEGAIVALLGLLFAVSSMTLYGSFLYMDAGIASTLLFVYPIMVALIMILFFKERPSLITALSIALAFAGIALLNQNTSGGGLNAIGVILVMASALSYAIYIVVVNRTRISFSPIKLTFYVLLVCVSCIMIHSTLKPTTHLQFLPYARDYLYALMLAWVPTIFSLVFMTISIRNIGSTPSAIMGALEPLTAIIIGIFVFNEAFSLQYGIAITLILLGVLLIIVKEQIEKIPFKQLLHNHREKTIHHSDR